MTTRKQDYYSVRNIYQALQERRQIAVVWSVEDVQHLRPDLDERKAWRVLQYCDGNHDAEVGINWDVIATAASDLFPTSIHTHKTLRA